MPLLRNMPRRKNALRRRNTVHCQNRLHHRNAPRRKNALHRRNMLRRRIMPNRRKWPPQRACRVQVLFAGTRAHSQPRAFAHCSETTLRQVLRLRRDRREMNFQLVANEENQDRAQS